MGLTILFVGYGMVAHGVAYMYPKIMKNVPGAKVKKIVIIEPRDLTIDDIPKWMQNVYTHIQVPLEKETYRKILNETKDKYRFNLIIDLSVNVDGLCLLNWCQENDVLYVNTALEDWSGYESWNHRMAKIKLNDTERGKKQAYELKEHTLAIRQHKVRRKHYKPTSTTAILESGQNPGMVSHFTKIALKKVLFSKYANNIPNIEQLRLLDLKNYKNYSKIACGLGLEVIHIAEKDTQIPKKSAIKKYGPLSETFYNFWSCKGYVEESIDPTALGFGTHEQINESTWLGKAGHVKMGHQIVIPIRSMNVLANSVIPNLNGRKVTKIKGRVISHGEASTICQFLQIKKKVKGSEKPKLIYRPSVYYVYESSPISQMSLSVLKKNDYKIQKNEHVFKSEETLSGSDTVGSLLIFSKESGIPPFYMGTIVDNDYLQKFSPVFLNATTIQVLGGIYGSIAYMLKHPKDGVHFSETLPSESFVKLSKITLGTIYCDFLDYEFETTQFEKLAKGYAD